ncbi:MAG: formimidoylglutamate deiminase, partial [Peristeroidobacter soli]
RADFFSLSGDDIAFEGRREDALLDSWIFGGGQRGIDGVWRAGRRVVSGGRHEARDPISAAYRKTLKKLLADS